MAEGEGFEPPQTESESGVLPLHKPSIRRTGLIINPIAVFVKNFFPVFSGASLSFLQDLGYPPEQKIYLLRRNKLSDF